MGCIRTCQGWCWLSERRNNICEREKLLHEKFSSLLQSKRVTNFYGRGGQLRLGQTVVFWFDDDWGDLFLWKVASIGIKQFIVERFTFLRILMKRNILYHDIIREIVSKLESLCWGNQEMKYFSTPERYFLTYIRT